MNNLEILYEEFKYEVEALSEMLEGVEKFTLKAKRASVKQELGNITSNLNGLCDALYGEFESSGNVAHDYKDLQAKFAILSEFLAEKLDHDEKIYIRLKHGIDL